VFDLELAVRSQVNALWSLAGVRDTDFAILVPWI